MGEIKDRMNKSLVDGQWLVDGLVAGGPASILYLFLNINIQTYSEIEHHIIF